MKLHTEELQKLCFEPYMITVLKSRGNLRANNCACDGKRKMQSEFYSETLKGETTWNVGGLEDLDICRRLTLKWILTNRS
jgi:hypothetical protein